MHLGEQFAQSVNQPVAQSQLPAIIPRAMRVQISLTSGPCCSLPTQEWCPLPKCSPWEHLICPGNRFPRPSTASEPWGHSIILTPQRQNVMERKGTGSKSSNQGSEEGYCGNGLDRSERPLSRGSISQET